MKTCVICGAPLPPRRSKHCSAPCEMVTRERYRAEYASRRAKAEGRSYHPYGPRKPQADPSSRLCSRTGCDAVMRGEARWCDDHAPRFEVRPVERATLDDLTHATYAGESIAAQISDSQSDLDRKAANKRASRLARRGMAL